MKQLTSNRGRLAVAIGFSACLLAPQTVAAQILTAPRYHGLRPAGCVRETFLDTAVRDCVYPDNTFGMWTDQGGGAMLLACDDGDGNGLTFTDDGLYIFGHS